MPTRNPKPEIRRPVRRPKADIRRRTGGALDRSRPTQVLADQPRSRSTGYWSWSELGALVLREGGAPARDLLERTACFGEAVIRFVKRIPRGPDFPENNRIVDQLVGAATSVGANYCEADDAVSRKDFKNKIGTCRKESKETMFFLRMAVATDPSLAEEARQLYREARELNRIFGAIWRR